jgi:hypothetical protein
LGAADRGLVWLDSYSRGGRPSALAIPEHKEKNMSNVRAAFFPYCLKKQPDGRYIILNRAYKPLGFLTKEQVVYENYPIQAKLRIRSQTAAKLSYLGDTNTENIFLYADNCIRTKAHMQAYMNRLQLLANLKVVRNKRER